MNFTLLATYVSSIFFLVATPGPVVALIISTSSRHGFKRAFYTALGTNWASLVIIAIAAMAISGILSINVLALRWVSLLGCIFIGKMAISSVREEFSNKDKTREIESGKVVVKNSSAIATGFLLGISNPKDIIFFVSFFPQFIGVTDSFKRSLLVLTFFWIATDFLILIFYMTVMKKEFIQKKRRAISLVSSTFLLAIAVVGFCYELFLIV